MINKIIAVLAFALFVGVSVSAEDSSGWWYVNTLDGVNVRDKPNGKKKAVLKCNQRVKLLEKTDVITKIGELEEPWCKIRAEDGTWGFVYGAYISSSKRNAEYFRIWEALYGVSEWFSECEEYFKSTMSIDTNMRDVASFEVKDRIRLGGDFDGVEFFLSLTEDKNGKSGWFLFGADIVKDTKKAPKSMPIKVGDSIEKLEEIFGKPNGSFHPEYQRQAYEALGNRYMMNMFFLIDDEGTIRVIRIQHFPEW